MLNFQIALTNVKFDENYGNVLRFETRKAQQDYFNVASLFVNKQNVNFNVGALIRTTITYKVQEDESINELLSKNYCIVKDNTPNATLKYYYYFVTSAIQDSAGQLKLDLKLDVYQTYYIDLEFSDCQILKAHLNRFVQGESPFQIKFDGRVESKLFEREDIQNVAKRLVSRKKISLNTFFQQKAINDWLDENVIAWAYAFVDPFHEYKFKVNGTTGAEGETSKFSALFGTQVIPYDAQDEYVGMAPVDIKLRCIAVPITKSAKFLQIKQGGLANPITIRLDETGLNYFMNYNEGASYVYALKLSPMPPFNKNFSETASTFSYEIDANGNLTIEDDVRGSLTNYKAYFANGIAFDTFEDDNAHGVFSIDYQMPNIQSATITTDEQLTFDKRIFSNPLSHPTKDPKYNPKLLGADYKQFIISDHTANGFEYDVQKLNTNQIQIAYTEPLSPDISRCYIRISNLGDASVSVYSIETTQNYTGFVGANDMSLTLYTTQYQNMLANNKNFYLQNNINFGIQGAKVAGNIVRGLFGDVKALTQGGQQALSLGQEMVQFGLTIDNMKNAPASIKNATGNPLLNMMTCPLGVYIETYDILPNEKQIINDYMCMYGFTTNLIGNIKDYDNIRKYYNYIRAEIEEIGGINISNAVHNELVNIFRRGIRMWNVDTFSYELENYENWLEA